MRIEVALDGSGIHSVNDTGSKGPDYDNITDGLCAEDLEFTLLLREAPMPSTGPFQAPLQTLLRRKVKVHAQIWGTSLVPRAKWQSFSRSQTPVLLLPSFGTDALSASHASTVLHEAAPEDAANVIRMTISFDLLCGDMFDALRHRHFGISNTHDGRIQCRLNMPWSYLREEHMAVALSTNDAGAHMLLQSEEVEIPSTSALQVDAKTFLVGSGTLGRSYVQIRPTGAVSEAAASELNVRLRAPRLLTVGDQRACLLPSGVATWVNGKRRKCKLLAFRGHDLYVRVLPAAMDEDGELHTVEMLLALEFATEAMPPDAAWRRGARGISGLMQTKEGRLLGKTAGRSPIQAITLPEEQRLACLLREDPEEAFVRYAQSTPGLYELFVPKANEEPDELAGGSLQPQTWDLCKRPVQQLLYKESAEGYGITSNHSALPLI